MADYQITNPNSAYVQRISDGTFVCPGNAEYDAWLAAGNTPDPYVPPPPPVPNEISDRQFFQQLAILKIISQDEALAAVKTGTLPAPLQALIAGIPADQQFGATMILSGATTFYRSHPLTIAFGSAYGWKPEQIDGFFQAASAL